MLVGEGVVLMPASSRSAMARFSRMVSGLCWVGEAGFFLPLLLLLLLLLLPFPLLLLSLPLTPPLPLPLSVAHEPSFPSSSVSHPSPALAVLPVEAVLRCMESGATASNSP